MGAVHGKKKTPLFAEGYGGALFPDPSLIGDEMVEILEKPIRRMGNPVEYVIESIGNIGEIDSGFSRNLPNPLVVRRPFSVPRGVSIFPKRGNGRHDHPGYVTDGESRQERGKLRGKGGFVFRRNRAPVDEPPGKRPPGLAPGDHFGDENIVRPGLNQDDPGLIFPERVVETFPDSGDGIPVTAPIDHTVPFGKIEIGKVGYPEISGG